MQSHGYRCLKEYDLYSVRWEEKPLELIKCIQAMLNNKKNGLSEERALSVKEAVNKLGISGGFIKRKFLELMTTWGRHGVRTREESKISPGIKASNSSAFSMRQLHFYLGCQRSVRGVIIYISICARQVLCLPHQMLWFEMYVET
ncbi:uncharacterized protein LOC111638613 [Centruroides sculpturatus]|uniref:uncharacterized protein LOC111638613 n=1 Tax=Centruroides sculpturatus TaxID=218467 RepID=UPI000C6C9E1B|nr:uncharacterized protein LOC111638613 [Centruroides sculpturatus]